jgi:TrmH family RNA methyltransferase
VVEGVRLAEEAQGAGLPAQLVLHTAGLGERGLAVVDGGPAGRTGGAGNPEVLRAASDTQSPQGILAVLPMQPLPLPDDLDFAFIPDGVRDPGNLGTMLRTAAAAGVGAVLLPEGSADAYAPKVVRAAMGAHFQVPVHTLAWEEIEGFLRRLSLNVYLAGARAGLPYTRADFRSPLAVIIGGEAEGAGEHARQLAHDTVLSLASPGRPSTPPSLPEFCFFGGGQAKNARVNRSHGATPIS